MKEHTFCSEFITAPAPCVGNEQVTTITSSRMTREPTGKKSGEETKQPIRMQQQSQQPIRREQQQTQVYIHTPDWHVSMLASCT